MIQLLSWIRERLPAGKVVSLVCVGSFPGHPRFKGLGELTPDELASLLETRQRVSEAQYSLAKLAWQAFREPTPEALDNLRQQRDTTALPFLTAAVARFLQEYPWTTDGLSRTERRLLQSARVAGAPGREARALQPQPDGGRDCYAVVRSAPDSHRTRSLHEQFGVPSLVISYAADLNQLSGRRAVGSPR